MVTNAQATARVDAAPAAPDEAEPPAPEAEPRDTPEPSGGARMDASPSRRRSRGPFLVLLITVLLASVPFGAVLQWTWSLVGVVIAMLILVWSVQVIRGRRRVAVSAAAIWWAILPFSAAILWAAVQSWPEVAPDWSHPIWRLAAEALGQRLPGAVAVNPDAAMVGVTRLLIYAGVFWLALQYGRSRDNAKLAVRVTAYVLAVFAFYGLAAVVLGSGSTFTYDNPSGAGTVTSTFINRNSYATFAGLGLLCAVAVFMIELDRKNESGRDERERREILVEWLLGRGGVLLLVIALIFGSVLLTQSRGGLLSTVAAIGTLVLMLRRTETESRWRRATVLAPAAAAALLVPFLFLGGGGTSERLKDISAEDSRLRIFATTVDAIADRPWLGTGLGTYEQVIRLYDPEGELVGLKRAHNSYLENAVELGIPAAACLVTSVAALGILCFAGFRRRRRDRYIPAIAVAAVLQLGLHSLVDFSLQIPGVAFLFFLLLGVGCAQSWNYGDARR